MKTLVTVALLIFPLFSYSQNATISALINQTVQDSLVDKLREFSGEDSCLVQGVQVLIRNRVSNSGNDVAAEYIKERLEWYGLDVIDQVYSAGGRNIYAVQSGTVNPDSIYIICGHYDAVANYCADDNASSIVAILESARILSNQCFKNTIIYAAWDEEEIGFRGSRHFANLAESNGDRTLGVLNMDMMAYDDDNDTEYDIDLNFTASSEAIKDTLLAVTADYQLNLIPNVVQPGTFASDHSSFWNTGYGAVLLGEAWSNGDVTPGYHTSNDRIDLLNMAYFHEMTKLCMGYLATVAEPHSLEVTVSATETTLTADPAEAEYQWIKCDSLNSEIVGETGQSFTPTADGDYAVVATMDGCSQSSNCIAFEIIVSEIMNQLQAVSIHPNPTTGNILVNLGSELQGATIKLISSDGSTVYSTRSDQHTLSIDLNAFPTGIYFLELYAGGEIDIRKVIKY